MDSGTNLFRRAVSTSFGVLVLGCAGVTSATTYYVAPGNGDGSGAPGAAWTCRLGRNLSRYNGRQRHGR